MITLDKYYTQKNSPIALFDSGVGGLTVLNELKKILPNENFVYYGDTLHMPYGEKTKAQLLEYSDNIFKFFESKNCKCVVMACNTTSSVIYEDVKNKYNFKLYSIVHSVSEILSKLEIERLGIFATRATITSGAYQTKIAQYNKSINVFGQYCPQWVHIVEENAMNIPKNIEIIRNDLEKMLKNKPEKIVLGCTHYPFLLNVLEKFADKDIFIDPAKPFAQYIANDLKLNHLLNDRKTQQDEFYVSSNPENFKHSAKMFYELPNNPELLIFQN
ncbi:glutamate racemase [bacterium]|nr:glutamate racemase [bacterium]